MKTNHLTDAAKILIIVTTIIVVCIICALVFKLVNNGKSSVTANSNDIIEMSSQYKDIDLSLYDGCLILGSEVSNIINQSVEEEQYLSIQVSTLDGSILAYNYFYDSSTKTLSADGPAGQTVLKKVPLKKSDYGYIGPMSKFYGETLKDGNGNIIGVNFNQQK